MFVERHNAIASEALCIASANSNRLSD